MTEPVLPASVATTDQESGEPSVTTNPAPTSTPTKPSTTISTIVVQSSDTRVVIALLKSSEILAFRILEMVPKLTTLGSDVIESVQMLNDLEEMIAKLEKKQTPLDDFHRQVDALDSNETPDAYVAMEECLKDAWEELNLKLGIRKEILTLGHNFHGYREMCLDSFRKYDNSLRKETLLNYSKATETGNQLNDKLRTLEDSFESILRVTYWLDDLRQSMLDWKKELQRQESKEKETKIYNQYLEELRVIESRKEDYMMTRTELLSMFTKIEAEFKLGAQRKNELELLTYEILQRVTEKIEILENVKLFLNEKNNLSEDSFTEDYADKLELLKGLEYSEDLQSKINKRLEIRNEYDNILDTISNEENFDEAAVTAKLSQDETLDITGAVEAIKLKFQRDKLGPYELFKERVEIIEASIKEGGELQDYLLLNDIVEEVETDANNAKDFNKKDEIIQKCKNLAAIIQHRIGILQDIKKFITENKDLSDDSFRTEHTKALRRLTDSKDGRILSCILRNRLTVRNVYELILKSPLDYEEEEIAELISVDQTLETNPAVEKIMARRRLLELLKTLDFPLPENLEIARNDLKDFESFEQMVTALPNAPEELVTKTQAKKTKILKCIQFYEILEQNDNPEQIEMLAALERELFGTSHWSELIPDPSQKNADFLQSAVPPNSIMNNPPPNQRDSISEEDSSSLITSVEVGDGPLKDMNLILEEDRISTATPSLNLSEADLYTPAESEGDDRFQTPISDSSSRTPEIEFKSLKAEPDTNKTKSQSPTPLAGSTSEFKFKIDHVDVDVNESNPTEISQENNLKEEEPMATIGIASKSKPGGDAENPCLGFIELEAVLHRKDSSEISGTNELLNPIHETRVEVEVLQISKAPVELQNIGGETQIVQEPQNEHNVTKIMADPLPNDGSSTYEDGTPKSKLTDVPLELENIGKETQIVEEPHEIESLDGKSPTGAEGDGIQAQVAENPEEPSGPGAAMVEEQLEFKNIGKQTIIIEEPIEFEEMDDSKHKDVRVRFEEIETVVIEPKAVTQMKTTTEIKSPQDVENETVEAMLAELREIVKLNPEQPLTPEQEKLLANPIEPSRSNEGIVEQPVSESDEVFESPSDSNLSKIEEEITDREEAIAQNQPENSAVIEDIEADVQKYIDSQSPSSDADSQSPPSHAFANANPRSVFPDSVEIPVEVIITTNSTQHESIADSPDYQEIMNVSTTSLDSFRRPDGLSSFENGEHIVEDVTVETNTVEFQTEFKVTVENKPLTAGIPKEQNNAETQTITETPENIPPADEQNLLGTPTTENPENGLTEISNKYAHAVKIQEESSQKSMNPENISAIPLQISIETQTTAANPDDKFQIPSKSSIGSQVSPQLVSPKSNKPPPNVRPPGLTCTSPLPRKSAFVETQPQQRLEPANPSCETQTSPIVARKFIYKTDETQTSPFASRKRIYKTEETQTSNGTGVDHENTHTQTQGISPKAKEYATDMVDDLFAQVERMFGNPDHQIPPQNGLGSEIEHPDGLLEIINREGSVSPSTHAPLYQKLEGFKSPVQEMETQTMDPPSVPLCNSECQTHETLKRLDSSSTQTILEKIGTLNAATQTEAETSTSNPVNGTAQWNNNSRSTDPHVGTSVVSPVNYFSPEIAHERIPVCSSTTATTTRLQDKEDMDTPFGTSEKIRIFENITQTEAFVPITTSTSGRNNVEKKTEREITIIRPIPKPVAEIPPELPKTPPPVSRVIDIHIPPENALYYSPSPQVSPYTPFMSMTPEVPIYPTVENLTYSKPQAQPREYRNVEIQLPPAPREVFIKIQPDVQQPPPSLYPWRSAPANGVADKSVPDSAPPTLESMTYSFGHLEETKETITPEKQQPSVRDRVKYWEPRTMSEENMMIPKSEEKFPLPATTASAVTVAAPMASTASLPDNPMSAATAGPCQYRLLFQSPTSGSAADLLTELAVANSIEERQKELAEHQQRGTVSEFRKMFQSYEKSSTVSSENKSNRTNTVKHQSAETVHKISAMPPTETLQRPVVPHESQPQPMIFRRHSDTITEVPQPTTTQQHPKSEEVPKEGTVARFKKLFQNFERSESTPEESTPTFRSSRHELVTSPPGFRTFDRLPPKQEFFHEETERSQNTSSGEWVTSNKVFYTSRATMETPLSPPPRPTKFVPLEFHESDYESDYDCRIPPIWIPPSAENSRPPSSLEFRSITPLIHGISSSANPLKPAKADSSGFIPIKRTAGQVFPPEPIQNQSQSSFTQIMSKFGGTNTKPIPPPKPLSQSHGHNHSTFKETSVTSKMTKTEETKFLLRPVRSPQPDSDEALNVRKLTSPTSNPWISSTPKTTTRIYKTEEFVEKRN